MGRRKDFSLFLADFERELDVKRRKKTQKAEKQQIRFLKVEKVGFWAKSKKIGHFGRAGPISPTFESGLDLAGRFYKVFTSPTRLEVGLDLSVCVEIADWRGVEIADWRGVERRGS